MSLALIQINMVFIFIVANICIVASHCEFITDP